MNTHLAPKHEKLSETKPKPPEVLKMVPNTTEPSVKLLQASKSIEEPKKKVENSKCLPNVSKPSKNEDKSVAKISEPSVKPPSELSMEDRRRNQIHAASEYFRKLRDEANKPIIATPIIDMAIPTDTKKDIIDEKMDIKPKVVKRKRKDAKDISVKKKQKVKHEIKG